MKIGVAYNVFDGLELLSHSIESVKHCVDYICVVYQSVSNFGEPISSQDLACLDAIKSCDIEFIQYVPLNNGGHVNEQKKRNIGLDACRRAGCTYFMSLDTDELYVKDQLITAIRDVVDGGYDSSACQMQTYYKTASYVLDPPESYYVPLLYRVDGRNFDLKNRWPVAVDPTRRLQPGKMKVFVRQDIEMHHFSYVRRDLGAKLRNSSARANFHAKINRIVDHYNRWSPGQKAYLAGREERFYDLKQIDPIFKINFD